MNVLYDKSRRSFFSNSQDEDDKQSGNFIQDAARKIQQQIQKT